MKNALVKGAISLHKLCLFKKNPLKNPSSPRIIIFSTTGVGDTLWGTPAIRAIKKSFPEGHITVITSRAGKELLFHNPYVDKILTLDTPQLKKAIQSIKADTALIFHISQRVMMPLSYFSNASRIVGSAGINKGLDNLLTHCLEKKYEHEIERRLRQAQAIGAHSDGSEMEIFLNEDERANAPSFPSPLIAIHPGSKDRFKQYPPHLFAEIGKKLSGTIVITGGKDEIALCKKVATQIPGSISLAGKLNLRELAALIEKCNLFITNDTGPMHIAFAMKTKTVALFGPTDPKLCGPYNNNNAIVLQRPPTCTPCLRKKCLKPFCMHQISPEEVVKDYLLTPFSIGDKG